MYNVSVLLSIVCVGIFGMVAWAENPPRDPTTEATSQAMLPLTKIVLYASGVGYFQRDGHIDGQGQVALRFKVDNINDLLKSMIAQDFDGGQVTTVTYDGNGIITSADTRLSTAIFRGPQCVRTVTHEIGHAIGFLDHTANGGLMDPDGGNGQFTAEVTDTIRDLYSFPPGTAVAAEKPRVTELRSGGRHSVTIIYYPVRR